MHGNGRSTRTATTTITTISTTTTTRRRRGLPIAMLSMKMLVMVMVIFLIGGTNAMSLDRLALERNELPAIADDKVTAPASTSTSSSQSAAILVDDMELSAVPEVGGPDAFILVPAEATNNDNDNVQVQQNSIDGDGDELAAELLPGVDAAAPDMLMLESDDTAAMQLVELPADADAAAVPLPLPVTLAELPNEQINEVEQEEQQPLPAITSQEVQLEEATNDAELATETAPVAATESIAEIVADVLEDVEKQVEAALAANEAQTEQTEAESESEPEAEAAVESEISQTTELEIESENENETATEVQVETEAETEIAEVPAAVEEEKDAENEMENTEATLLGELAAGIEEGLSDALVEPQSEVETEPQSEAEADTQSGTELESEPQPEAPKDQKLEEEKEEQQQPQPQADPISSDEKKDKAEIQTEAIPAVEIHSDVIAENPIAEIPIAVNDLEQTEAVLPAAEDAVPVSIPVAVPVAHGDAQPVPAPAPEKEEATITNDNVDVNEEIESIPIVQEVVNESPNAQQTILTTIIPIPSTTSTSTSTTTSTPTPIEQPIYANATKIENNESTAFNAQLRRYDGAQVWRIVVQTDKDKKLADELQTKFDGQLWKEIKQEVDYLLKPQVLAAAEQHIRACNLSRIVLIDNLQQVIEVENPPAEQIAELQNRKGHRLTWQAYHRLDDIHGFIDYMAKTYPDICTAETIGYSVEKRPLKLLKISNGNKGNPGIWIDGGMHAREWISPAAVTFIANQLIEGWEDQPEHMRNIDWYIYPVANPDGYEYSHTTDRLWRKNMRAHGRQCPGVDLNRNFGYKWGGKGTSASPCSQTYRGSKAFSEPETFYISKFISGFPRDTFQAYLSFHSYGQYILYPWGYDYHLTSDRADLDRVARQAGTSITKSTGVKYTVGSSATTLYPAAGGSDDWAKGIAGIKYAYTVEMGDTGRYGFVLPAKFIEYNGKDGFTFADTVARAITNGADGRRRSV